MPWNRLKDLILKKPLVLWIDPCAMYLYYKCLELRIKYKYIILTLSFGSPLVALSKYSIQCWCKCQRSSFKIRKILRIYENVPKNMTVGSKFTWKLFQNLVFFQIPIYIFWKRKLRCIFLCKKLNFDFSSKNRFF